MNEGAVVLDAAGTIRTCNEGFFASRRFDRACGGRELLRFCRPGRDGRFLDFFYGGWTAARAGSNWSSGRRRRTVPAYVSIFPLKLAGVTHACMVITDLSDLASVERSSSTTRRSFV